MIIPGAQIALYEEISKEELVFLLLEEEKKIAEEKKITTEDCFVLGMLKLNGEIADVREEIAKLREEFRKNFKWLVALILGMWFTLMAAMIPILLKLVGVI